jgi:hypothetical protein
MKTRTILTAAAAPAALAAVLLGTAGHASAAVKPPAPATSAYFWQPNGNALGGPQQMPGGTVSFNGKTKLATVTEKLNNTNIFGTTITITGTLTNKDSLATPPVGGSSQTATMRVYFQGAGAGTNANSPNGYEAQQWWADAKADIQPDGTFTLTATVGPAAAGDPAATNWVDWNGQSASANPDLFQAAASHAQSLGLSFGGDSFFEDGVTGSGSLQNVSIQYGS